ncbi:MAG: M1 family aminopeptidase [bacterium]
MEHQTITSLGGYGEYLIVHELAHSWWGDMVTCDSFHHIWLNEGFATYSEALWSEVAYGTTQYHQDMELAKYFGGGTIYVPDPSDFSRIFHSGLSYNKASWVLHMLRHIVGDATFFQILQTYYADSRYQNGTATTEEFRDLSEAVSGMDLDWFFHEWIYEEYYPQYAYDWTWTPVGGQHQIDLTIDQLQTNYTFKMPIDVTVTTAAGDTTFVVWDSLATQDFAFTIDGEPVGFRLDKDGWILRTIDEPLKDPTFDRGVLVVNGVDFDAYGSEIWTAYEDSVFWGDYDMTFWDVFDEPGSGYPANLPAPIGHGPVPADTIKQFSSVVWVGNNYNGDLSAWADTPALKYLENGGNVLLMTRMGQDFITEPLRDYLGITWREFPTNTISNCVTTHPGIVSMAPLYAGGQTYCAVFDTSLATTESTLLLLETATFATNRGLGVYRHPAAGGTHRADGGRLAFVSGRPYRWNHDHLRTNVEYILGTCFNEPFVPTAVTSDPPSPRFELGQNYPNPFNPETRILFTMPSAAEASLKIYDVSGRLVRNLVAGRAAAGPHTVRWDGTNNAGEFVASGVYFYRLITGSRTATKKMVLLR